MKKKAEEFGYGHFLGKTLAKARNRLRMTQREVAARIDVNPSDLSRIEHGTKPIKEALLFKICNIYGVKVSEVATETHELYKAYLLERTPEAEPVEEPLPSHPFAVQVLERFESYAQSRHKEEREFLLTLLRYAETLKAAT